MTPPGRGRIQWLAPLTISFVTGLRTSRRCLYSGGEVGQEIHAAAAIPRRAIVLDRALLDDPSELRRIVTHELFHFAWARLGNPWRLAWEQVLAAEIEAGGRGELGWSADWRKRELSEADRRGGTAGWRAYACESFCDSAAWWLTGARPHSEATLGKRRALARGQWFVSLFRERGVSI